MDLQSHVKLMFGDLLLQVATLRAELDAASENIVALAPKPVAVAPPAPPEPTREPQEPEDAHARTPRKRS